MTELTPCQDRSVRLALDLARAKVKILWLQERLSVAEQVWAELYARGLADGELLPDHVHTEEG